jgi:Uma2 family endonuclease
MWDLEYFLLFGIPDNKIELIKGRSRWAFPFRSRDEAESHFTHWLEAVARWKQAEVPLVRKRGNSWKANFHGIRMELYPRPVEMRLPIDLEAFHAFYSTFWDARMWPGAPAARHCGWLAGLDHQDVQMQLWVLFGELCKSHGGQHSGRVAIALSDSAAVEPDQYYYSGSRQECMIDGDYFCGVPDLIAEVLAPCSYVVDRGPRMELYRRSGVPHFWLLDPDTETVEIYELTDRRYRHVATYRAGEQFTPLLFPGSVIPVDRLFDTQNKRHGDRFSAREPDPRSEWLIAADKPIGLEYFFLFGHPDRRWEIWGNKAPSVLAFGSAAEAKFRLEHFVKEACQWESKTVAAPVALGTDVDQVEVGRFKFTRSGKLVHLDVAVDARRFRELLTFCAKREAWDWGEE